MAVGRAMLLREVSAIVETLVDILTMEAEVEAEVGSVCAMRINVDHARMEPNADIYIEW